MKTLIKYSKHLVAGNFLLCLVVMGPGLHAQTADAKRQHVRGIYNSQIGVREKQANAGAEVERYLRYVNLPKGNPWCAAFVCWALGKAGVGNPGTGWSPGLFPGSRVIWEQGRELTIDSGQWTMGKELKVDSGKLKVGGGNRSEEGPRTADIFGLYFPEKSRIAHVGFVDEWQDSWVTTVEGNTNVLGSSEGDGVYRKRRLVRSIHKVARYVE